MSHRLITFNENPTKNRTGDLTAKHRKTPQEIWAKDGSPRDPVRIFEEFLNRRPLEMRTSSPLYLAIIQRPKTEVVYAKSRMGAHKVGSENLSTAPKPRRKADFQSFDQKISCGQTEESWTTTTQYHSNHRPCQRKLTTTRLKKTKEEYFLI